MTGSKSEGFTHDKFAGVREVFEGNLASGADIGATFCATLEGETVVDLWGGYADEARTTSALTWRNLRQQNERPQGKSNYCLADFVAPKASGVKDYVGAFAVTAGLGIEKKLSEFEAKRDDYSAIMLKALADRKVMGKLVVRP